ncbi:MAG TPA: hypothetical protein VIC26_13510, partial [Marinagarivorans sp.]
MSTGTSSSDASVSSGDSTSSDGTSSSDVTSSSEDTASSSSEVTSSSEDVTSSSIASSSSVAAVSCDTDIEAGKTAYETFGGALNCAACHGADAAIPTDGSSSWEGVLGAIDLFDSMGDGYDSNSDT